MVIGPKRLRIIATLCLAALTPPVSSGGVTADLPPGIRSLLQQEMLQVDAAMKTIHGAIIRGDHETVQEQGRRIHDSFILAQSMTTEKREALKAAVPEDFLELDREFHELAARLAESGRTGNTAGQQEIFGSMTGACVTCHRRHVGERFDGLGGP